MGRDSASATRDSSSRTTIAQELSTLPLIALGCNSNFKFYLKDAALARGLLLQRQCDRTRTARRPFGSIAYRANIDLQFVDSAAQRVTVHPQLAGGLTLISMILFKDSYDKALFEFAHRFRIKDAALIHRHH